MAKKPLSTMPGGSSQVGGLVQAPSDQTKTDPRINSQYQPGDFLQANPMPAKSQDMNPAAPNSSFTPLLQQPGVGGATGSAKAFSTNQRETEPTGSSGTQLFGGYFSEEYLHELRGRLGAIKFDEMRRSEPQIAMLIGAVLNAIKSGLWEFESYKPGDANYDRQKDFIEYVFTRMLHLDTFKHEALTHVFFGFVCFEKIHKVVLGHPVWGDFVGLNALAFRSQKTIYRWNLEKKTGRLLGVEQYVFSDIGDNVYIPGEFLMVITHNKEGDNLEGIGALRAMYGPWVRKNLYHKLVAIGIEKYAIGTPIGTVPAGKENTEDMQIFKDMLAAYTSHETASMTIPEGWKIEIQRGDFDPSKIKEMIVLENTEMINALQANFLALGMSGAGGAYALSGDLSDFFLKGIKCIADNISTTVNKDVIEDLIRQNFGPQDGYPKMKISGINDKAGKELAEAMNQLVANAKAIKPDRPLEDHLRKIYALPKSDPTTQGEYAVVRVTEALVPETVAEASQEFGEHVRTIKLAEKKTYKKQFDADKEEIKAAMRDALSASYDVMKDRIRAKYKAASPATRMSAVLAIEAPGKSAYKAALSELMAEKAAKALSDAAKLIPKAKNVKLAELSSTYDELTAKGRHHIKSSNFVFPEDERYPIHDISHARNALARSSGTSDEAAVKAAVYRKYPALKPEAKLSERFLLDEKYDALPLKIRKIIDAQAGLVSETQLQDLEKVVYFQFASSAGTENDIDRIINDIDEKILPTLMDTVGEGGARGMGINLDAAAGDLLAQIVRQTEKTFYFDEQVADEIESFTFTNDDPVSDICQALEGTVLAADDPDLDTYWTPLHHNCKSRWSPNLKGDKSNPEVDVNGVSLSKKALDSITLSEPRMHRIFTKA